MYITSDFSIEEKVRTITELGICSTCNYLEECVRRSRHGKAVWDCEEFDSFALAGTTVSRFFTSSAAKVESANIKTNGTYKGLCSNCDVLSSCSYPKPDEGVWHCNEYL